VPVFRRRVRSVGAVASDVRDNGGRMTVPAGDLRAAMFGRFRIVERLGRGGMGDVYRARDESLARDVAVKVLPPQLTGNPRRVERFTQHGRRARSLQPRRLYDREEVRP
jgi:serine/threonine protein kinase